MAQQRKNSQLGFIQMENCSSNDIAKRMKREAQTQIIYLIKEFYLEYRNSTFLTKNNSFFQMSQRAEQTLHQRRRNDGK